jgi:predicted DNA-binding transcriptional regulator YafY
LRMKVTGLNDLKRWVLGYGKGAIVKSPPELVQLVGEEVEAMSHNYDLVGVVK